MEDNHDLAFIKRNDDSDTENNSSEEYYDSDDLVNDLESFGDPNSWSLYDRIHQGRQQWYHPSIEQQRQSIEHPHPSIEQQRQSIEQQRHSAEQQRQSIERQSQYDIYQRNLAYYNAMSQREIKVTNVCEYCLADLANETVCGNCDIMKRSSGALLESARKKSHLSEVYLNKCTAEYFNITQSRKLAIQTFKSLKSTPEDSIMKVKGLLADLNDAHDALLAQASKQMANKVKETPLIAKCDH